MSLLEEELVLLRTLSKTLPNRPHLSTMMRWRTRGIRGVRLEAVLVGGVWCSSGQALRRFFAATTNAATKQNDSAANQSTPACQIKKVTIDSVITDLDLEGI